MLRSSKHEAEHLVAGTVVVLAIFYGVMILAAINS